MAGFTLETNSFGSRLFVKSSPNKIVNTFQKALITNDVQLELCHNNADIYDFVVSIRRNKTKNDDGLSYSYALQSHVLRPELKSNGYYCSIDNFEEYFDECPKGTWQLQVFLKNKETKLTEHFIYIDLVFSNELQIQHEMVESKSLEIRDYFYLPEDRNIVISNSTGNLYYSYVIYRKENNKFTQYYRSKTYPITDMLNVTWKELESSKSIEKHILTGLNDESHIYIMITSDSKQSINLPEFTYLKYKVKRTNNLQIIRESGEELGNRNILPTLGIRLRSKFEPSVIPSYSVQCEWILLNKTGSIKRVLLRRNFDNNIINTETKNGQKEDIIIPDVLNIDGYGSDYWNKSILPENYLGELSKDILIRVTVTGSSNSNAENSLSIDEATCEYRLTRESNKPIIAFQDINSNKVTSSDNTINLGKISIPPVINYTVKDSDSPNLIIKEVVDLNNKDTKLFLKQFTINEVNNKVHLQTPANSIIRFDASGFSELEDGLHTYSIYAGDGVNEPVIKHISFEKLPNKAPIITGTDNTVPEEIYIPKEFKYSITDPEKDVLFIEEYYDDILINSYTFNNVENQVFDERIINYENNFISSLVNTIHTVTVKVSDGANVSKRIYTFKKVQGPPPIISGTDTNLKKVFKPRNIEYNVMDPSKGALTITEYFDGKLIRKYNVSNTANLTLDYSKQFNNANIGFHNITIIADNGYDTTMRLFSLEKIPTTIDRFLITPENIGGISGDLIIVANVWNILGNEMQYDIVLNDKIISSNNEFKTIVEHVDNLTKYKIDYILKVDSEDFKNLPNKNTIKFIITDTDDCVRELVYTFNKVNKSPKLTVHHSKFDLYLLQIKNQIIQCYNENAAKLIIKLNDKDINFGTKSYIDIPKNTFENQYVYLFSLSNDLWNKLDKYSENKLTFVLTDLTTKNQDTFEYNFIKGHNEMFAWRPNVSDEGLLQWTLDSSQNIPEPANIKGPIGQTGNTPKIKIGNVDSIEAGEKPTVTISNDDINNPILDFKLPKAEGISKYISSVPSTVKIGGLDVGFTSEEGMDVVDLIYQMLHPYTQPNITIQSTPSAGYIKAGTNLNVNSIIANVEIKSNPIESVKLFKDNELLQNFPVSSNTKKFEYKTVITINKNTTFKFDVFDGRSTTSKSISYTFINPIYYGNATTVPTDMTGLTEELIAKSNKTIIFTSKEMAHQVFAYPSSYGKLNSITDSNGFNCISGFDCIALQNNNVEYYVYCTKTPSIVTGYKYNFNF